MGALASQACPKPATFCTMAKCAGVALTRPVSIAKAGLRSERRRGLVLIPHNPQPRQQALERVECRKELKKNISMTLGKTHRADLIRDHHSEYWGCCNGVLQGFEAQPQVQHGQVGLDSQGARWCRWAEDY